MSQQYGLATLEQAERAEQALAQQSELAALAPQMRRQRDADRRQAERGQAVALATQQARDAVTVAIGQIGQWRVAFLPWVEEGFRLAKRMRDIQAPLFGALRQLVASLRAQLGRAANVEQMGSIHGQAERAAYTALQGLGAFSADLAPFPEPGNGWASAMIREMNNAVGQVYKPHVGVDQFRRGKAGR